MDSETSSQSDGGERGGQSNSDTETKHSTGVSSAAGEDNMGNKNSIGASSGPTGDVEIVGEVKSEYSEISDAIADKFVLDAIHEQDIRKLDNVLKAKVRLQLSIWLSYVFCCLKEVGFESAD